MRNIFIILSVACGCLAQFYFEFPQDKIQLLCCIVAYGLLTVTGHAIEYFGMRGCIAILTLNNDNNNQSKSRNSQTFFRNSVLSFYCLFMFYIFEYPCAMLCIRKNT